MTIYEQATRAYKKKNYRKSLSIYQQIIETNPDDVLALQGIAKSLASLGDFIGAKKIMAQAIEINPRDPSSRILLAKILYAQKEFDVAEDEVHLLMQLDLLMPEVFLIMSDIYTATNRIEAAVETLKGAIQQIPRAPELYLALANKYISQQKYQEAIYVLKESIKLKYSWRVAWMLLYVQVYKYRNALAVIFGFAVFYILQPSAVYRDWVFGAVELGVLVFSIASFFVGLKRQAVYTVLAGCAIGILMLIL